MIVFCFDVRNTEVIEMNFGRTVFLVFRDAWGQITMIPQNVIKSMVRIVPLIQQNVEEL